MKQVSLRYQLCSFLALLWAFVAIPAIADEVFKGQCVEISDGDAISVMRDGREVKVRLYGIDCPESSQAFGTKAKQFAGDLALQQEVLVEVRDTDRYGRLVGKVTLPDGRTLNHELVRAGLAWWYREYAPDDADLKRLENEAQSGHAGLWADAHPVAPWDFRHGSGPEAAEKPDPSQPGTAPMGSLAAGVAPLGPNDTVFVTATGAKYHRDGCRYLTKSKTAIKHVDAVGKGLSPCRVCKPVVEAPLQAPANAPRSEVNARGDIVESDGHSLRVKGTTPLERTYYALPERPEKVAPPPRVLLTNPNTGGVARVQTTPVQTTPVNPPGGYAPNVQPGMTASITHIEEGGGYVVPIQPESTSTGVGDVYITNTGKKFHHAGCRYLSRSQIPISRQDAQSRGYTPCLVCRP